MDLQTLQAPISPSNSDPACFERSLLKSSSLQVSPQAETDLTPETEKEDIDPYSPPPGSHSIDQILAEARSHLQRLTPGEAYTLLTAPSPSEDDPPAVLVDIRPVAQRREEGSIEGALIIERNVLEWRFDPRAESRLPMADRYDLKIVVFCSEGYTSSLAARSLQKLGLSNTTDIIGGYKAWWRARLGGVGTGLPFLP
ncbi:hypothetical protein PVAG01_09926 [Phlyctema vagabunda]|uniref:Rhodanese domain-containing protein n=1 Tax=Phlyctema vagabunda TaxID=108571 RepID=A0ABR4P4I8_9HELO